MTGLSLEQENGGVYVGGDWAYSTRVRPKKCLNCKFWWPLPGVRFTGKCSAKDERTMSSGGVKCESYIQARAIVLGGGHE